MASVSVQSSGGINVGDRVQIKAGGMDVTNGLTARAGSMYGEGGPLWATVVGIYEQWPTGGLFGQAATVTKVRCAGNDGSTIVWQVQPSDIAGNRVTDEEPEEVEPEEPALDYIEAPQDDSGNGSDNTLDRTIISGLGTPYAIEQGSEEWWTGSTSSVMSDGMEFNEARKIETQNIGNSDTHFSNENNKTPTYRNANPQIDNYTSSVVTVDQSVKRAEFPTAWEDSNKRRDMLNQNKSIIQNNYGYPYQTYGGNSTSLAQYDYQFIPSDSRYRGAPSTSNLETDLMNFRASVGLPVHGNREIAKSMKYYMYNRYKVPDMNRAFSKTFTHVFFTRPDLNILDKNGTSAVVAPQCMNHTETALLWRRQPELFKLLVDGNRCGDTANNFNMLLSNQVMSFAIEDEELATIESNQSWDEHTVMYGDIYKGRGAGTFTCSFAETQDLAIIHLMRLWVIYIDNVRRGAWLPSYNLEGKGNSSYESSHVFSKTLDYAASAYVFKCGPDGEDVLYWSKYYGIFPTNTGASALSWSHSGEGGPDEPPQLDIRFAYSMKRDMSPISLLEFNHNAYVKDDVTYLPSWVPNAAGTHRPFVGTPYIEMVLPEHDSDKILIPNDVDRVKESAQIRLKFRSDAASSTTRGTSTRQDKILFKANLG